jgi:hypothetical protein
MATRSLAVLLFAAGTLVAACSQPARLSESPENTNVAARRSDEMERLVEIARKDHSKKAELARVLMSGDVLVIPDPQSSSPALLFFDQPERAFIPVFSDRKTFDEEAYGTGFEGKAVSISAAKFASLLHGDEIVILNSGRRPAIEFRASDLKALVNPP